MSELTIESCQNKFPELNYKPGGWAPMPGLIIAGLIIFFVGRYILRAFGEPR